MIEIKDNAKQCKDFFKQIANDKNSGKIKTICIKNFPDIDKEIIFCILKMLPPKLTTLSLQKVNLSDKDIHIFKSCTHFGRIFNDFGNIDEFFRVNATQMIKGFGKTSKAPPDFAVKIPMRRLNHKH